MLEVIRNQNFRHLWLGQITSQIAINMMAFVLVLRVYETTTSNTAVSLLMLVIGVPAIFVGILAGTLVDRWDKRDVLLVINLLRMVFLLGFFISSETLVWVYILVLAISVATQFFVPAEGPTIPRLVRPELLLSANSLFSFSYYTSMILGFVLSGPTLRFFGHRNVFLFLAALLGLAAYFVSQIPAEGKKEKIISIKDQVLKVWQEFLVGLGFIKKEKIIFNALFLLTASQALVASLAALTPGFAHKILGIAVDEASYTILGPAVVGMLFGALVLGQFAQKTQKQRLINLGIILTGVCLFFLATVVRFRNIPLAASLLFLLGLVTALVVIPANTILQEEAPATLAGRVYGFLTSLVGGAAILPVIFTGIAADILGIGKVILALGSLVLFYGIYRLAQERYTKKVLSFKY